MPLTAHEQGVAGGRRGLHPVGAVVIGLSMLLVGGVAGASTTLARRSASATPLLTLPVAPCATDYGITPPPSSPPTPNRLPVVLPSSVGRRLSFYSNGFQTLLAPRGWACHGLVAADGGRHLSAFPAGDGDPLNPAQSRRSGPAVTVLVPTAGTSQVAAVACALFPPANTAVTCSTTKPTAETVQRPTDEVALFHDPAHVKGNGAPSGGAHPADGAVIYVPQAQAGAAATCTLASQGPTLCPWIVNDFLARNYPTGSVPAGSSGSSVQ